jgi:hypothetical protein
MYIIDIVANMPSDLSGLTINGKPIVAVPRLSNDGSLFLLEGDQFEGYEMVSGYPNYFATSESVLSYLSAHSSEWTRDI